MFRTLNPEENIKKKHSRYIWCQDIENRDLLIKSKNLITDYFTSNRNFDTELKFLWFRTKSSMDSLKVLNVNVLKITSVLYKTIQEPHL